MDYSGDFQNGAKRKNPAGHQKCLSDGTAVQQTITAPLGTPQCFATQVLLQNLISDFSFYNKQKPLKNLRGSFVPQSPQLLFPELVFDLSDKKF